MYDTENYYYLRVSCNDSGEKVLGIIQSENNAYSEPVGGASEIDITGWDTIHLRVDVEYDRMQFLYSKDGVNWDNIGRVLDASYYPTKLAEMDCLLELL